MDERLMVPKALRPISLRSLHYGHPGCDCKLATVANIWWPRLNREIVSLAKYCQQGQAAGKITKSMLRQKETGRFAKCNKNNQEKAIDFAGPFHNAINAKKYLLISVGPYNG